MKSSSFATIAVLAALATAPTLVACTDGDPIEDGTTSDEISARPRVDLWKDGGAFVFALISASGETLIDSQDYANRAAALGGLVSVLENGTQAARYTIAVDANGSARFQLLAANRQVIGTSQTYASRAAATTALNASIAAVKAYPKHWTTGSGARFKIAKDAGGKHYFHLHAANGAIVLRSERYETLGAALNGAFSVTDHGTSAARYQILTAASGGSYLNLIATNGQVIATSEVYSSSTNATRARDAIIALLPSVTIL